MTPTNQKVNSVTPYLATIDAAKNPKWLDMTSALRGANGLTRCIYELDGDRLRVCMVDVPGKARPAEFTTDEEGVDVLHFRREKLPPSSDQTLVGSWASPHFTDKPLADAIAKALGGPRWAELEFAKSIANQTPVAKATGGPRWVEIVDGFLFAYLPDRPLSEQWVGGKYTVDATKNPKWIDVELSGPFGDEGNVTKLYGCYEVSDTGLALALGTTGKRALRPLEFKDRKDVLYAPLRKVAGLAAPSADNTKSATPSEQNVPHAPAPLVRRYPDKVEADFRKLFEQLANRDMVGPEEKEHHEAALLEMSYGVMRGNDYAEAEVWLRKQLTLYPNGPEAEIGKLFLGICLLQRAADAGASAPDARTAVKMRDEAVKLFKQVVADLDAKQKKDGHLGARDSWVRVQAGLRVLQTYQLMQNPNDLLAEALPMLERHRGTVNELITLSLVYHAYKQKNESGRALRTRDQMRELFERLPPNAFPAKKGEYSRDYWLKTWFADGI